MRRKIEVLLKHISNFFVNTMHMLILYNPLRNSIQNSVSLKFGNSATAMIRTTVFTVLVSRYGLLEVENIPPACKNTLVSAFS